MNLSGTGSSIASAGCQKMGALQGAPFFFSTKPA